MSQTTTEPTLPLDNAPPGKASPRFQLFIMMVLEIAVWGAWLPLIFPYMKMLGYNAWQQSLVGNAFGVAAILGIFFSNQFADRNFSAERFLAFSHLVGGIALLAAAFVKPGPNGSAAPFWPFFACFLIYSLLYVPTISVTNSLAFANLKDPAKDFGFVRMGGTVGWIVVSWPFYFLLSDNASVREMSSIFIVAAVVSFAMAAYSLTLPHTPPRKDVHGLDRLAWLKAARLLGVGYILVLFFVTFIDSTVHNGYFVVAGDYLKQAVHIPSKWVMVVMSIGQIAEILAMLILGKVLLRLGWKWTMLVGILGHAARFSIFAFFPDAKWLIVAIQLVHGVAYAFFFVTVYIFVDAVFPKDIRSSAQGLFNLLILGVGQMVASSLFPKLAATFNVAEPGGWRKLFLVYTAMAIGAIVLMALFFRPPTRRPESVVAL
jgi:nucleoside transporter